MNVCVLLSGGLDSVTVLYHALREQRVVACLSFDYGSKHNAREIPFARLHVERNGLRHEVVRLLDPAETWSCYKGGEIHCGTCGTCGTCTERREAFHLANLPDPTAYQHTPPLPAAPKI